MNIQESLLRHIIDDHGCDPGEAAAAAGRGELRVLHRKLQIAETSKEAYEAACDRFEAISGSIQGRKRDLLAQIQALEDEYDTASDELARHEDHRGIPLYDRCPRCVPGWALPRGHEGACRETMR